MFRRLSILLGALAFAAAASTGIAQSDLTPRPANTIAKPYIVQLAADPILIYEGGVNGIGATKPGKGKKVNPNSRNFQMYQDHLESLQTQAAGAVGAQAGYHYSVAFNGFSAVLTDAQVEALKARDDVIGVYPDELLQPHTNSTPNFLNLTDGGDSWSRGYVGEDVIIGVIDSGIQGDHPSFADVPTPQKGNKGPNIPYDAPPADWSGSGCDLGAIPCSNKLLKAEAFNDSFQTFATSGPIAGELFTAQDTDGHGTHTASTAGGNWGVPAEVNGEPLGTVSGIAPRARVAAYKVCYDAVDPNQSGCYGSDSMAGIDQAVADGVDVINFSIGGSSNNFTGPDDIAFLLAANAGVWVATSNGNAGPNAGTTGTPSGVPWITAVGATEDDENFGTALEVQSPASLAGDYEGLEGSSPVQLTDTGDIVAEVESANPLDACTPLSNDLTGKIALAVRGVCAFSVKYNEAAAAGAEAIVVYNDGVGGAADRIFPLVMSAPGTTIPGMMVSFFDGETLNDADTAGETIIGRLSPDILIPRVDRVAGFSSRGPNNGALDIIKPDISAPGVRILAGETLIPNDSAGGGQFFAFLSGTSMASPHAAGTFALLKQAHPDWSAAQAKSALMTTARQDLRKTFGDTPADPFDIGAGLIQPNEVFDPGLTYDAGLLDYLAFMCFEPAQSPLTSAAFCDDLADAGFATDSADLNLASIGIGALAGNQTVTRTVTGMAPGKRPFHAVVEAPPGVNVSVSPSVIQIRQGESASYEVTFSVTEAATLNEWAFGSITWTDDDRYSVRSPIAVRPVAINAPEEVEGSGTDGSLSFDVDFGYTGPYNVSMEGLFEGVPFPGAVEDGDADLYFFTVPAGTEVSRISLFDEDVGAGDGSDDLDMQVFGPQSAGFPFLGSSGSPTSEEEFNIVNPEGGGTYAFFVIDFASAPGPTPYTAWVFNQDGTDQGNTTLTAPASATVATTGTVTLDWFGLTAGTRNLGTIVHSDGSDELAGTEVMIDAQ